MKLRITTMNAYDGCIPVTVYMVWQIDREVLTTLDNSKTGVTVG